MAIYKRGAVWQEKSTGDEYTILYMCAVGPSKLAGIACRNLNDPKSLSLTMTIAEFAANFVLLKDAAE
jgi:hypothetical protein